MTQDITPKQTLLIARAAQRLGELRQVRYAILRPDFSLAYASPGFEIALSEAGEANEGEAITNLVWELAGAEAVMLALLQGAQTEYSLGRVHRPQTDGSLIYLNLQLVALSAAQPGEGLLLRVEDATERSQLEQELVQDRNELRLAQTQLAEANEALHRLNRLKSFFLSMAAHDMRAPLTTISGYADLMLHSLAGQLPERQYQHLQAIQSQAYRLNQLITSLLNIDQIEQGKLRTFWNVCNLNTLAQEVVEMLRVNARAGQVTLTLEAPKPPLEIMADEEKVRQILYNLISNAIKYGGEEGTVLVEILAEGEEALLLVHDNGPGMTREQIGNLFQPYYRTEQAQQSRKVGTGLGLYITRTLVDAHNGTITAESLPGIRTTFRVRLPRKQEGVMN